jgi:hypothetical protein
MSLIQCARLIYITYCESLNNTEEGISVAENQVPRMTIGGMDIYTGRDSDIKGVLCPNNDKQREGHIYRKRF